MAKMIKGAFGDIKPVAVLLDASSLNSYEFNSRLIRSSSLGWKKIGVSEQIAMRFKDDSSNINIVLKQ